jgi:hypothetical protein
MANPYPMQGQPMMQQPQMQQPPMGTGQGPAQMRPPVVRRGTSRVVPVVVSAGLAIGVFCGLLFGLGVDQEDAVAATTESTTVSVKKPDGDVAAPFQPEAKKDVKVPSLAPQEVKEVKKDGTTVPVDPTTKVGSGSGSGSGAETAPAKPVKINGTLKVDIQPEDAAKIAKVTIDGKEIEGVSFELDMTEQVTAATKDLKPDAKKPEVKKELKVIVKATGFRDFTSKVDVVAERDTTLKVTMQKRSSGGGVGNLPRPPPPGGQTRPPAGGNKPKCPKPPCGLIDI